MSKIVLYSHGGSGNHGCEAIVRGTVKVLDNQVDELYSYRVNDDNKYGLNELLKVQKHTCSYSKFSLKRILASLKIKLFKDEEYAEKITYDALFNNVNKGDIALSIGGDNYCYDSFGEHALCNKYLNKKGVKTVLWECSVEPSKINELMKQDMLNYSLIVARETITYNALKKFHNNVVLSPDPAFSLDIQETHLPDGFELDNAVGINVSPVVINYSKGDNIVLNNFENMIEYIIANTTYKVALIPHVTWDFTDDRKTLKLLYDKYKGTGRVILVEEHNAMEMKYIISKCKMFIGARTHATIAAYSTCVPTLVLGYSIKAKGIAKDLFGTYEDYVVATQELTSEQKLIESFKWLEENQHDIRAHLENKIPEYIKRHENIKEEIYKLRGE